ncbi:magnesium transporter [Friedmanniella endophytica]|uniref:Magnesium transporter n=1 Tax=Microlunatus kandeliicorticis TaxID=1759536 RepID=A0A7W3INP1_9ACTN|nr:CorA family divalent cation transporter [Microlunatus kandeliicorticis]MBA8792414.1 magnesium transporter [Microlunatus kandeliicorticis]
MSDRQGSGSADGTHVPRSRVWVGDRVVAEDVAGPETADLLHHEADACAWAVVDPSDHERIGGVIDKFGLDEWVRRDLLGHDHHPEPDRLAALGPERAAGRPQVKYEEFGDVRLVITAATELPEQPRGRDALDVRRVAMVITPRLLLVVAGPEDADELGRHLVAAQSRLGPGGTERAAQAVLHGLSSGYFTVVQAIEDAGDELADALFDLQPLSREEKGTAFRLRRTVTELRRVTVPMREVVEGLGQSSAEEPGSISRSWNLLIEHQTSVSAAADDLRDSLGALFDTSLAFDDSRMNEVMKKLTGWAAIVAVPTLVSGFAGMNVPFWGNGHATGFYVYLAIMAVACVSLYVVFKRLEWI